MDNSNTVLLPWVKFNGVHKFTRFDGGTIIEHREFADRRKNYSWVIVYSEKTKKYYTNYLEVGLDSRYNPIPYNSLDAIKKDIDESARCEGYILLDNLDLLNLL